ncbi:MFS general substrate transporter [Gymnopus androsaceus JB14]|uniref:MFS general substrate transporter n=1 Tax=Gymnopus androsaceus JB14 TaxID=1447944 RepID=A0A6A4I5D0_9AGAR|nr:MFS general substrate transporter [Gymnopus androsaceus JB14]
MPFSAQANDTPRSSLTVGDAEEPSSALNLNLPSNVNTPGTTVDASLELEQEVLETEGRIEKYGGNDVRDPLPKATSKEDSKESPAVDPNLVSWDGPTDPSNPQNFEYGKKWSITLQCVLMSLCVAFGSSAPTPCISRIISEFKVSEEVSYLMLTLYLVGFVLGPPFWGPGSEMFGRRMVLTTTMSAFTLFHLGQALAPNMQTFLVSRFFCGFFGVAPFTICGGVIADVWPALGRGPATSLFSASTFMGPVLGPIVGGFIAESSASWRWAIWTMMIFAGVATAINIVLLPETYAPVLLLWKVKRLRKEDPEGNKDLYAEHEKLDFSIMGIIHQTVFRPFQMLVQEPILVLVTVYISLVYGVLYALFEAIPLIFETKHGFTVSQSGLVFIGVGIGTSLGSFVNAFLSRHYVTLVIKWRGFPPPEQRLFGSMIGGPCLVIGAFWLGWTGEYPGVSWAAPAVSTILIGFGISAVFIGFLSYLVDTYLMYAASAFAANTIARSLVAAAFPLFTVQMYERLGINWASTLIGLIALVLCPVPFLFYKYGARIRSGSKFAPCIDLKIAAELKREEQLNRKEDQV